MNRPFHVPAALPHGPDHLWAMLREAGPDGLTLQILGDTTLAMPFKRVSGYVNAWRSVGAVVRLEDAPASSSPRGKVREARYAIAPGVKDAPVLRRAEYTGERGQVQQYLWNAMRQLRNGFSLPELAFAARTPDLDIKVRTAETYVRRLMKAGLVIAVRPYRKGSKGRKPGALAGHYRLKPSANTGPRPLKIFDTRFVFDPNTGRMVGNTSTGEARHD